MVRPPCVDSNGMKKGAWSEDEDNKLRAYVQRYGHWNWRLVPKYAGLARCGKSCRLRWVNYLKPGVKRGNFTQHEEQLIIQLHSQLGNKWSAIAAKLPGRTDNEIKNFWHTRVGKQKSSLPKNKAIANEASSKSHQGQEQEQIRPSQTTMFDPIKQLQDSFDAKTSEFVDSWPHLFLPDHTTDYFPQLEEDYNFHFSQLQYSELSSSDSSYLSDGSALDRINGDHEDIHSIISSDYIADQSMQGSFWSDSFAYNLNSQIGGQLYDPSLQYFDDGVSFFR